MLARGTFERLCEKFQTAATVLWISESHVNEIFIDFRQFITLIFPSKSDASHVIHKTGISVAFTTPYAFYTKRQIPKMVCQSKIVCILLHHSVRCVQQSRPLTELILGTNVVRLT